MVVLSKPSLLLNLFLLSLVLSIEMADVGASPVLPGLYAGDGQVAQPEEKEQHTRLVLLGYILFPQGTAAKYLNESTGTLTSLAESQGPLGKVVYLSSQLGKFRSPPPENYDECTVAGDIKLLHQVEENPVLYIPDHVLNSQSATMLQSYIYSFRLPPKPKPKKFFGLWKPKPQALLAASTIRVAKTGIDVFMMGIPKNKLSQIGMKVWCVPRGCTTSHVLARWDKELRIIDWPEDLHMPSGKPTSKNHGISTPTSFGGATGEGESQVQGHDKAKGDDCRVSPWVKDLFATLPLSNRMGYE